MNHYSDEARALFLSPDGNVYPDSLICSGILPAELGGKPCPFSQAGRIPEPHPLDAADPSYTVDKGQQGDLCPPCAKQQLVHLGHWHGHGNQQFPEHLSQLRLFKCRQWFWLVIPGLLHAEPTVLQHDDQPLHKPHQMELVDEQGE